MKNDPKKSEIERLKSPDTTSSDTAYLVTTGILSIIPGASELFQYFVTPPLEKRRRDWMDEVGKVLYELQTNRGVNLEELQTNDAFIDTVLQATQIASRSSQQEKRDALRNAILNAALPSAPEQSLQQIFLTFIDTFTVWHIRILDFFHEPAINPKVKDYAHRKQLASGLSTILEKAYPELTGNRALYDQIWQDLSVRGLVNTDSLHAMMSSGGLLTSRTTKIGKDFIKYIKDSI
ncbi:MAG: hypothetical protein IT327_02930 [Anaerolineae bacterium]|nr:hypothetical protein [Anaerolineae bacterium]